MPNRHRRSRHRTALLSLPLMLAVLLGALLTCTVPVEGTAVGIAADAPR